LVKCPILGRYEERIAWFEEVYAAAMADRSSPIAEGMTTSFVTSSYFETNDDDSIPFTRSNT
jgi:hypothetical protein